MFNNLAKSFFLAFLVVASVFFVVSNDDDPSVTESSVLSPSSLAAQPLVGGALSTQEATSDPTADCVSGTGDDALVIVLADVVSAAGLKDGDKLYVTYSGVCVGVTEVSTTSNVSLIIWGEDPFGFVEGGIPVGAAFTFNVYRPVDGERSEGLVVQYSSEQPFFKTESVYSSGAIYVPSSFVLTTPLDDPPTLLITSPPDNAQFEAPASISISASATDDIGVEKVVFELNKQVVEDITEPYSATFNNVPSGDYVVSVTAFDTSEQFVTSTISLSVVDPVIDGLCGSSADSFFFSDQTPTDLCDKGIASDLSVSSQTNELGEVISVWTWTCDGINGGSSASCVANKCSCSNNGVCEDTASKPGFKCDGCYFRNVSNSEICSQAGDEDCDGESDYDSSDGLVGDSQCPVSITSVSVNPPSARVNELVSVECTVSVSGVNSVFAYVDNDLSSSFTQGDIHCPYVEGVSVWNGNVLTISDCLVGDFGNKLVGCSVYSEQSEPDIRAYQEGSDVLSDFSVFASSCSSYSDETSCQADVDCEWCSGPDCLDGKRQLNANSCVTKGSCPARVCDVTCSGAECDATNKSSCVELGFDYGTTACNLDTCKLSVDFCSSCGDGVVNSEFGEECDGASLNSASCESLGFDYGVLSCSNTCSFDTSNCKSSVCGDGVLDPEEECDDANTNSLDGCSATCSFEHVSDVIFSPSSGYYVQNVVVSLSSSTPGAKIYYSLDDPVVDESDAIYVQSFNVSSNVTVYARAFLDGWQPSNISNATYFVFDSEDKVPPVINFLSPQNSLFDINDVVMVKVNVSDNDLLNVTLTYYDQNVILYQKHFGNSGLVEDSVVFNHTGNFTISVEAEDSAGLKSYANKSLSVENLTKFVDIVFPLNGSQLNQTFLLTANAGPSLFLEGVYLYVDDLFYGSLTDGVIDVKLPQGNFVLTVIADFNTSTLSDSVSVVVLGSGVNLSVRSEAVLSLDSKLKADFNDVVDFVEVTNKTNLTLTKLYSVSDPLPVPVYAYFDLSSDLPTKGFILFSVDSAWLKLSGLAKDDITLYHFKTEWVDLNASYNSSNSTHLLFQASADSFSPFAVGEKQESSVPPGDDGGSDDGGSSTEESSSGSSGGGGGSSGGGGYYVPPPVVDDSTDEPEIIQEFDVVDNITDVTNVSNETNEVVVSDEEQEPLLDLPTPLEDLPEEVRKDYYAVWFFVALIILIAVVSLEVSIRYKRKLSLKNSRAILRAYILENQRFGRDAIEQKLSEAGWKPEDYNSLLDEVFN